MSARIGGALANAVALAAVLALALVRAASIDVPGRVGAARGRGADGDVRRVGDRRSSRGWTTWRRALRSYGLPDPLERVSAFAVPAAEALVALLPILGLGRAPACSR